MSTLLSRRGVVTGLAVSPIAAASQRVSASLAPPVSEALKLAVERCEDARAALDVTYAASPNDDALDDLTDDMLDALDVVVNVPCANYTELGEKLRYLTAHERRSWGDDWISNAHSIAEALDLYFADAA